MVVGKKGGFEFHGEMSHLYTRKELHMLGKKRIVSNLSWGRVISTVCYRVPGCSELRLQQHHLTQHGHPLPLQTPQIHCALDFSFIFDQCTFRCLLHLSVLFFLFQKFLTVLDMCINFIITPHFSFSALFPLISTPASLLPFLPFSSPVAHPHSFSHWNPSPQPFLLSCLWPIELK